MTTMQIGIAELSIIMLVSIIPIIFSYKVAKRKTKHPVAAAVICGVLVFNPLLMICYIIFLIFKKDLETV